MGGYTVALQFHTVTADERKRCASVTAIIPPADARAYGMVTARKANGGRSFPRTRSAEHTSDCVVTTAQGDTYTIKRGNGRSRNTTPTVRVAGKNHAADYATLVRIAGTIGNSNH